MGILELQLKKSESVIKEELIKIFLRKYYKMKENTELEIKKTENKKNNKKRKKDVKIKWKN